MEYLFIKRFMDGDDRCLLLPWTDQMHEFFWELLENYMVERGRLPFRDLDHGLYGLDFSKTGMTFLTKLTQFGLSLLRIPVIAKERFDSILKTAVALSALILDPDHTRNLLVVLAGVTESADYTLTPIVIYQNGVISDLTDVRGVIQSNPVADPGLFGTHIPDVDSEHYQDVVLRLQRIVRQGDGRSRDRYYIIMPIKQRGEYLGFLTAESDRSSAFLGARQVLLIESLRLMGKYLRRQA